MRLSIIIPTYRREKTLCNTIDSIKLELSKSNLCDGDYELIVVDQTKNHTSEVSSYLQRQIETVSFFKYVYEDVANLPNARNVGLSHASGDIILFLDDDVLLHESFFDNLMLTYQQHPEVSSVVGSAVLKTEDGKNILLDSESNAKLVLRKFLTLMFCGKKASVISRFGLMFSNREHANASYAESGRGCIMSFTRNVLSDIGGFDANYEGNALREESDVFVRLKKKGDKVFFNPAVALDHIMANNGGCRVEKKEAYWQTFFNNQVYFYRKNFGFSNWYIKLILSMNIRSLKKKGFDTNGLYANALNKSEILLGK